MRRSSPLLPTDKLIVRDGSCYTSRQYSGDIRGTGPSYFSDASVPVTGCCVRAQFRSCSFHSLVLSSVGSFHVAAQVVRNRCLICSKRSGGTQALSIETSEAPRIEALLKAPRSRRRRHRGEENREGVSPSSVKRGSGERCKLSSEVRGQSLGRKRVLVHFGLQKRIWCVAIWYFLDVFTKSTA